MALSIDIAANTRAAQAQVKDLGEALDDVGGALDDLARDATRSGDKVENALDDTGRAGKDAAKDIDAAGERIERTFKDIVTDAKKADKAVENVGDSGKKGFGKASEAVTEFKDEALSNLSEVTSSFDGSMSSVQDLVQGTLGGLAGSLPGIGLAAAGAAAGVGLIGAAMEANAEATEAAKARIAEWAEAFTESGGRVLSAAVTTAKALEIVTDPEMFTQAQTNAKNWGVDIGTAIAAAAGETWALAAAQKGVEQQSKLAEEALAQQERQVDENAGAAYDLADSSKAGADALAQLTGEIAAGSQQADAYSQYLRNMAENTDGAKKSTDDFGDSVYALPDGTTVYVDAQTGQATRNIDDINAKIYSTNGSTATVRVAVDDSAWRYWQPGDKIGNVRTAIRPGSGGGTTWF